VTGKVLRHRKARSTERYAHLDNPIRAAGRTARSLAAGGKRDGEDATAAVPLGRVRPAC